MWKSRAKPLLAAALALTALSCDLVDLRGLDVTIYPTGQGSILPSGGIPRIEFSEGVDRLSAERAVTFSSQRGGVEADYQWSGLSLSLSPRAGLENGVRYTVSVKGQITKSNLNAVSVDASATFYYATDEAFPTILSTLPEYGAVVGVAATVELRFSAPMDRESVEDAFSLSPSAECRYSWPSDDVMVATPVEALSPLTYYSWRLSNDAATQTGVRVWSEREGTFYTAADFQGPDVLSVDKARYDQASGQYVDVVPGADGLARGQVLLVTFSEPVDMAEAVRSIRVETGFRGTVVAVSSTVAAFEPEPANNFGLDYTLVVPKEIQDLSGIAMQEDYRLDFSTADMGLDIEEVSLQTDTAMPAIVAGANLSAPTAVRMSDFEPYYDLRITIVFSLTFADAAARLAAVDAIMFDPYFPAGAPSPTLFNVSWPDARTLVLHYQGVEGGDDPAFNYYKLIVPKGIKTDTDSDFYYATTDEAWLYIEMEAGV